jgi:hypothetical protein
MGESKRRQRAEAMGVKSAGAGRSGSRDGGRFRFTWKGVGYFLLAMLLLDVVLYAVFRYGFESCYALLCLLE